MNSLNILKSIKFPFTKANLHILDKEKVLFEQICHSRNIIITCIYYLYQTNKINLHYNFEHIFTIIAIDAAFGFFDLFFYRFKKNNKSCQISFSVVL